MLLGTTDASLLGNILAGKGVKERLEQDTIFNASSSIF